MNCLLKYSCEIESDVSLSFGMEFYLEYNSMVSVIICHLKSALSENLNLWFCMNLIQNGLISQKLKLVVSIHMTVTLCMYTISVYSYVKASCHFCGSSAWSVSYQPDCPSTSWQNKLSYRLNIFIQKNTMFSHLGNHRMSAPVI